VTDASVVVGPAIAHHGWKPTDHDALAGAVVTGHVIECGTQATGGNFSGFRSLPGRGLPLGFPIAEVAADGSSVITKHAGTGGAVTVDTVTAQLLYEIQSSRYLGPDVTTLLDTIRLEEEGPDRVAVTGVSGDAPPARLKVCVNELGGHRNAIEFVLTGLDIDAKADWVREQMESAFAASGATPASVTWSRTSVPHPDANTEEAASCLLRCGVMDPDSGPVGKSFTAAAIELALASYPGFTLTAPPSPPTPYGVYRPAYVARSAVTHTVVHADGSREVVPDPPETADGDHSAPDDIGRRSSRFSAPADVVTRRLPLGTFVHARSGDKGGDANLGLWVTREGPEEKYDARVTWLSKMVSPERVRDLVPEAEELELEVYLLPNLGAVNVLIHGLLGEGVAASTRFDPQAKGLGEWVRSRMVAIEESLL
ncbi:MAG: acyclic terpene utilization AtuA family protein, partial [Nocardioides sp.]